MSLPFHMLCAETGANLYQLNNGKFQIVTNGKIMPLIDGYDYILAEKEFAEYLKQLNLPEFDIEEAIIYDPADKTEIRTHYRLKIGERFSMDMINDVDLDGERIALMDGHMFVSPRLKKRLTSTKFGFLRFSKGLSLFVA